VQEPLEQLDVVLEQPPLVLEQVLDVQQVLVQQQEQELPEEQQWRHRNLRRRWRGSSWRCASTVHWCHFSKPAHRCHCASCQQFVRQRRLRELRRPTTSPLCSVSSWSSS
jgi:hypothetical protein